jgi:hypothetical protein
MTQHELIAYRKELISLGRTPEEIYAALARNATSKSDLHKALDHVFAADKPIVKRSSERVTSLLAANTLKLNVEYSLKNLFKLTLALLILGVTTYGLSSEDLNGNAPFGWMTLLQGVLLAVLYALVRYKGFMNLLLIAAIAYFTIWAIEILVWGLPKGLFQLYFEGNSYGLPKYRLDAYEKMAALYGPVGTTLPYIYVAVKLTLGWFIFNAYRCYQQFDALSEDLKAELKELK